MIFQLLLQGKLVIIVFLKMNIYRTNNIQKVLMPLMAKYTKITEPNSTMGNILKTYEIIIKAISISNAWQALYLTN